MSTSTDNFTVLKQKRDELLTTLKTVEDFPKKLDYDCMVPLTSVAFQPGKLVHTNEFYVTDDGTAVDAAGIASILTTLSEGKQHSTRGEWKSYFDAAEILRQRVQKLDTQLPNAAPTSKRASAPAPTPTSAPAQARASKPIPVRASQQQAQGTNGGTPLSASVSKSVRASTASPSLMPAANATAATGVFEIREFIDDAGNVTGHEVVDLAKQMKEIQRNVTAAMVAEGANKNKNSSTATTAEGVTGSASAGTDGGSSTDNANLHAFASSINDLSMDMEDVGLVDDVDGDVDRDGNDEYARRRGSGSGGGDSDSGSAEDTLARLSALELEEDEWEAAERFRERERALQERQKDEEEKAALPQASPGGWKKGFLGSGGGGKKVAEESHQQQRRGPQSRDGVKNAPTSVATTTTTATTASKRNVRWNEVEETATATAAVGAIQPMATVTATANTNTSTRAMAFTGTVMERFP